MSINPTVRRNHTEQGTGVDLEKGWKLTPNGTNLFTDYSDPDPEKTRDFKSMIHCCDKLPYMNITDGITGPDTSGAQFPNLPQCEDRYEYLHECGCPQVFLWEWQQGNNLMAVYFEADGQSNYNTRGTPDRHPHYNGSNAATDSMFGQSGANGFWSLGSPSDSSNSNGSSYALVCANLHKGCEYAVLVLFTQEDPDTNSGETFHGGAKLITFEANSCVHYLGGDAEGNHDPNPLEGPSTELIDFPDATGGDDGYVNIKSLHIQMAGIPRGRSQSDDSHNFNLSKC